MGLGFFIHGYSRPVCAKLSSEIASRLNTWAWTTVLVLGIFLPSITDPRYLADLYLGDPNYVGHPYVRDPSILDLSCSFHALNLPSSQPGRSDMHLTIHNRR